MVTKMATYVMRNKENVDFRWYDYMWTKNGPVKPSPKTLGMVMLSENSYAFDSNNV